MPGPAPSLPLIDFSAFTSGNQAAKEQCAQEILTAFRDFGFLYLANAPVAQEDVQRAFRNSAEFFRLPVEEKLKLAWKSAEANRGYTAQGREKTSRLDKEEVEKLREKLPDLKESLEIGKEPDEYMNEWPSEAMPHFQAEALDFFQKCHLCHLQVLSAIALALGLEEKFFDQYCGKGDNTLRLLHYPSAPTKLLKPGSAERAGTHTDYGSITLLFQDGAGGLEVLAPDGQSYLKATPIEGTIVVNAADLLARWSNDRIKSTEHRVVAPPTAPGSDNYPARYSIAYFCNPNLDAEIAALPGCVSAGEKPKYPPINSHKYLVERLNATY